MAKFKSKTISTYRKWSVAKWSCYGGMYVLPLVPASVMTGINWEQWFKNCGPSLPFGFITLLLGVVMTLIGIAKRDEIFKQNISGLFYFALVFAVLGLSFKFLSNICNQMGDMFLLTTIGIISGATSDQVNKSLITPRVKEYKKLIEDNCLDTRSMKKRERKERAEREAKEEAAKMQAVE